MLLQSEPNQSGAELAQKMNVSVRTIQRYISLLDEMGIPVYAEHGPYGGYALVRGYKMPPLVLTSEEAVAVHLGANLLEEVWGPLYREAARGALAKLDNVLPDEQRREVAWAHQTLLSTGINFGSQKSSESHLLKIRNAIHQEQRIRLLYRRRNQAEPQPREVDPYRLVHSWGWQYLIGFCHLRQAIRSFRVDRIVELTPLTETFETAPQFDLEAYLKSDPFFQRKLRMRLYFAPESSPLAYDNQALWDSLEEQADGAVITTYAAPDLEAAANFALRYGYQAVVLEPVELRKLLEERASAIAALYRSTNPLPIQAGIQS